jgi:hypothetical protein
LGGCRNEQGQALHYEQADGLLLRVEGADVEETKEIPPAALSRKNIAIRLLYTILYLIIFEILKTVIQVTAVFQYVYLLITRSYSKPLKNFSNKVATYTYKIIRYVTLNENYRPFPFHEFPEEIDKPEEQVSFD